MTKRREKLRTTWGFDGRTGQVTVDRPEGRKKTVTIEEAIEDAKGGDLQAAADCIEIWHSISYPPSEVGGHTPVEMPPVLEDFARWYVMNTTAKRETGRPRKSEREDWWEGVALVERFEALLHSLSSPPFTLSAKRRWETAAGWIADKDKVTVDWVERRLKKAGKQKPRKPPVVVHR